MRTVAKIAFCAALALSALPAPAGEVEDLERRIRETEERIAQQRKKADEASARAKETRSPPIRPWNHCPKRTGPPGPPKCARSRGTGPTNGDRCT